MATDEHPSDLEEEQYVFRSGVRTGLKREFTFAIRAQSELPSLFGRTRSSRSVKKPKVSELSISSRSQLLDRVPVPVPPSLVEVNAPSSTDSLDEEGIKSGGGVENKENLAEVGAEMEPPVGVAHPAPPQNGEAHACATTNGREEAAGGPLAGPLNEAPIYTYSRRRNLKTVFLKKASELAKMEPVSKPMEEKLQLESPVSSDKPVRRFTRSALMQTSEENGSDEVASDAVHDDVARQEQVLRRQVVRFFLKDPAEGSRSAVAGEANESGVPSHKNNMEIKMSKKISVNKVPGTVRDLLGTGLLEGLAVEYKFPNGRLPVLCGIIKGIKILCSCTNCRGSKAVSPLDFELHAKSMKKHPSKYIYLENGNNLCAVMKACAEVPLDMLESAIQEAAGTTSQQKPTTCMNCKGVTFILLQPARLVS